MCVTSKFDGHKIEVCRVSDLAPGDRYRTPDGRELLVTDLKFCAAGFTTVIDVATGIVVDVDGATRLGRDRAGRLYASRSLNPVVPAVALPFPQVTSVRAGE